MDDCGKKPEVPRSPHWPALEKKWLAAHPACEVCGATKDLQVHHKKPVHVWPELELDEGNLMTLCEEPNRNHHLWWGHLGYWPSWNVDVAKDAYQWHDKIKNRPTKENIA